MNRRIASFYALFAAALLAGCQLPGQDGGGFATGADSGSGAGSYLYVSSGACYGGGVTTLAGSGTIVRYRLDTGALDSIVTDYTSFAPGDLPVGIAPYDSNSLLVAVENAAGRRIDLVSRTQRTVTTYTSGSGALTTALRGMAYLSDGSVLVSRSSAVEKYAPSRSRVLATGNPWINAPAGACATSTTLISSVAEFPGGKLVFAHAGATPNNRFGLISASGYNAAVDCLSGTAGPATTALPTAVAVHPSGKLLVAYGSTTTTSNYVYAYDVNLATNAVTGATVAYSNVAIVNGPSALAVDPSSGDIFVANGTSTFNTIERFSFDSVTKLMTRKTTIPFVSPAVYTRCIAGMFVGT